MLFFLIQSSRKNLYNTIHYSCVWIVFIVYTDSRSHNYFLTETTSLSFEQLPVNMSYYYLADLRYQ